MFLNKGFKFFNWDVEIFIFTIFISNVLYIKRKKLKDMVFFLFSHKIVYLIELLWFSIYIKLPNEEYHKHSGKQVVLDNGYDIRLIRGDKKWERLNA